MASSDGATKALFFARRQTGTAADSDGGGHGIEPGSELRNLNRFDGGRSRILPLVMLLTISIGGGRRGVQIQDCRFGERGRRTLGTANRVEVRRI
jgi:hypothetical protein